MAGQLNINPSITYGGVLDFDGSVYASGVGGLDATGNKTLRWKMWLDTSTHDNLDCIFSFSTDSLDHLNVHFTNTGKFIVYTSNSVSGSTSGFTSDAISENHINNVIQCEVKKETSKFIHFKVDDVSLTGGGGGTQGVGDAMHIGSQGAGSFIENATVWDVEFINDDLVETVHSWKGYPAGDTDAAWVDDVSVKDLTVKTSPASGVPINTRTIEGVQSGSVNDFTKKLSLAGSKGKLLLQGTFVEQPWLSFITNASTSTFNPAVNVTSGINQWDLGDGSIVDANNISHTYSSLGNKEVNLYLGTIPSKDNITGLNFYNDNVGGDIDLRELTYLTSINFRTNENITSVKTPASSNVEISEFRVDGCDITGSLDLSGYGGMNGQLYVSGNPNLTSITLPDSSGTFTYIGVGNCGFSSLDFTSLTGDIDTISMTGNANLTSVLFPEDSSSSINLYASTLSSFSGTFDVSSLTGLYNFLSQNNSNITDIILPEVIADMSLINVFQSGLSGTWDLSALGTHFPVYFTGNLCSSLNGLIIPASSRSMSTFDFNTCDLTGTLDVSGLTGLGGNFKIQSNDNLTQILFPTSSETFSSLYAQSCDLTGTLDVSGLTGLGGVVYFNDNPNLTKLLLPTSSKIFDYFRVDACNLTGTLDLTGLTGLGGTAVYFNGNPLEEILFPDSSQGLTSFYCSNCPSLGTLDVSSLTGLGSEYGGTILAQTNGKLTSVLFPNTTNKVKDIYFSNCDITGTLDFTPLGQNLGAVATGGQIQMGNNYNLTGALFPDTSLHIWNLNFYNCDITGNLDISGIYYLGIGSNQSNVYGTISFTNNSSLSSITFPAAFQGPFTGIGLQDCSLNQSTVDNIFSLLNTQFSLVDPSKGLNVNVGGGTNMPPTDGSSNSDILSLETIFSNASQTLTITINE